MLCYLIVYMVRQVYFKCLGNSNYNKQHLVFCYFIAQVSTVEPQTLFVSQRLRRHDSQAISYILIFVKVDNTVVSQLHLT